MSDQVQQRAALGAPRTVTLASVAGDRSATVEVPGRPLFLRWLCLATASVLVLSALGFGGFASGVSGAPLAVALVIVGATVAVSVLAGVLHWRADELIARGRESDLARIRHEAQLVYYAVALFQVLGMIGALLGYRQQTKSASVIVWVMFLHLQHALDRPR
jgi:hypothetical protein